MAIGLVAATLTLAPVRCIHAQSSGVSLDVTVGGGQAFGGRPLGRRGFATMDALLAAGRRAPSVGSTLFALALGAQGQIAHGDTCTVSPGGRCLDDFPDLASAVLLAGRSYGLPLGSSVAVLGGAGMYFPEGGRNALGFPEDGGTALGLQARIDAASAVKAHLAFVVSLRGAYLPNLRGDSYLPVAFGVGVRLQ